MNIRKYKISVVTRFSYKRLRYYGNHKNHEISCKVLFSDVCFPKFLLAAKI